MKHIVEAKKRVKKSEQPPGKITNYDSELFYRDSVPFLNKRNQIHRSGATIFKCQACELWLRHNSQIGYCCLQKRITDARETCENNTKQLE